jgi:hypothetical protein
MRESFTPEEVDRIEAKAYEVGVGIGASQERTRILALLEGWVSDDYGDFNNTLALIKGDSNAE